MLPERDLISINFVEKFGMQTLERIHIKEVFRDSLSKSLSYTEYRKLMEDLVETKSTTGSDQSEMMVEYTMLNEKRMKRWDKTIKIAEDHQSIIQQFSNKTTWLVLTESWCGDAAHILPVIHKVAELNDNIQFRLVLRDEHEALMNAFLTNGGKSIPKLIVLDENFDVTGTFGPRPQYATKLVDEYKSEFGQFTPEFKMDLQRWYNKDKGQSTVEDLITLLQN